MSKNQGPSGVCGVQRSCGSGGGGSKPGAVVEGPVAYPGLHLTLMRPPVVKRQTLPSSGFLPFFSAVGQAERRSPLATCAGFIAVGWCPHGAAPNPSRGARAMTLARAESQETVCCARET